MDEADDLDLLREYVEESSERAFVLANQMRPTITTHSTMSDKSTKSSRRLLEPNERISEVLFGLIMVLTFTGSLSVAEADKAEVRTMLIGALGCNLAWGIIDGAFYLMGCLNERGTSIRSLRRLRKATVPDEGHRIIAEMIPAMVADALGPAELESIRRKLVQSPQPPTRPRLSKEEWFGALSVFCWVFVTTFPVALPFIFVQDVERAMRASNAIAVILLFLAGYAFGRVSEYRPWITGLAMVGLGSALVGMTIALGG